MEIYKMTEQEYIKSMKGKKVEHFYYSRKGQLIMNHKNAVIWAMQLGKNVSDEVLKSMTYPIMRLS